MGHTKLISSRWCVNEKQFTGQILRRRSRARNIVISYQFNSSHFPSLSSVVHTTSILNNIYYCYYYLIALKTGSNYSGQEWALTRNELLHRNWQQVQIISRKSESREQETKAGKCLLRPLSKDRIEVDVSQRIGIFLHSYILRAWEGKNSKSVVMLIGRF